MKKILTLLCVFLFIGCTPAKEKETIDTKLRHYYQNIHTLNSLDDVIGMEALGIETDSYDLDTSLISLDSPASISKGIIALTLHNDDTSEYIQMLEGAIHDNGAIYFDEKQNYANVQVYGVFALYVMDSPELIKASDYLASMQNENGSFSTAWSEDLDVTSWCVEALSLVDPVRYLDTIDLANHYMDECKVENYYDGGYGGNANTQACVLMGKLANQFAIKQDEFNYFNTFLLEDGSISYPGSPNKTNAYATSETAHFLGNMLNGNIYTKAREQYEQNN